MTAVVDNLIANAKAHGWAQLVMFGHSIELRQLPETWKLEIVSLMKPRVDPSARGVGVPNLHQHNYGVSDASRVHALLLAGAIAHAIGMPADVIARASDRCDHAHTDVAVLWRLTP